MEKHYLSIDVGTSGIKAAVFNERLKAILKTTVSYDCILPGKDAVELDFNLVFNALIKGIKNLGEKTEKIEGIGFSVLCPGLVPLDKNGVPLSNAIIHLDRRSRKQSLEILNLVGEDYFLSVCGNLPFSGGISLTSILWLKKNAEQIYNNTFKFGHTNTFLLKKITDSIDFYIDPTNASFTGLYKTSDLSGWATDIMEAVKVKKILMPSIIPSHKIAGHVCKDFSLITGIKTGTPVIIGAADTACAAFGADLLNDGDILNTTGTVEAVTLSLDKPFIDKNLLLRAHAAEGKWLSMFIIGAGGISFEWARNIFCREMERNFFYNEYLPEVLKDIDFKNQVIFKPYLCGDRLSIASKNASFQGLTIKTCREDIIRSIAIGILKPVKEAINKFSEITEISNIINYTGRGSSFLYEVKKKYFSHYSIVIKDYDTTLSGAVKLLKKGLEQ